MRILIGIVTASALFLLHSAFGASAATFTANALISETNFIYDGQDIVISMPPSPLTGRTVSIFCC